LVNNRSNSEQQRVEQVRARQREMTERPKLDDSRYDDEAIQRPSQQTGGSRDEDKFTDFPRPPLAVTIRTV
jgi:hypothetical protein